MRHGETLWRWMGVALVLLLSLLAGGAAGAAGSEVQRSFETPEAAVAALLIAFQNSDDAALVDLFGHEYADRLLSTDKVAAAESRRRVYEAAREVLDIRRDTGDLVLLVIGKEAWEFPVPLVRSGGEWRFHTAAGVEEILNRRIGGNERNAIRVCRAYLAAQWDYARKIRDASGVRKFAQRIASTSGKQDGLYWELADAGGEESPFGPLVAEYLSGGRRPGSAYEGYYFRVLTRQGPHVPGGRYNYVINGNMIAGFAMVAFPAKYGTDGIMTFVVSHHGKVYQKDLGRKTSELAKAMREYDPDDTWEEVRE